MIRDDHKKFNIFAKHFELIDENLCRFCIENNWDLRKNEKREPCRELRKDEVCTFFIGVYIKEIWTKSIYHEDLPHDVVIGANFKPVPGLLFVRRKRILRQQTFSVVRAVLPGLLRDSLSLLKTWKLPEILQDGTWSAEAGWHAFRSRLYQK